MQDTSPFVCEAKIGDVWRAITLDEARSTRRLAMKRCPDCHGAMSLHGGNGRQPSTIVHRQTHTGCPRIPQVFSGTASRHPKALG